MTGFRHTARKRSVALVSVLLVLASSLGAAHGADIGDELTEPIFTDRSFIEKNVELDSEYEGSGDGDSLEFSVQANWIFFEHLELGVEVPVGINFPDDGQTKAALSDVAFSAQVLLCCETPAWLDFFSLRAEVAPPIGDRAPRATTAPSPRYAGQPAFTPSGPRTLRDRRGWGNRDGRPHGSA